MSQKIRVGAFGAFRGITMITVLADHPDAELVAVCDKYEPLLQQVRDLAAAHNIEVACYTDFEEFFKHDMDAVVLANYATEHAPYAIRLLKSGRHVMSEVLPCRTMAEAVALIEAVEESGKVYAYAENYCYMQRTFEMWRRCAEGDIGEVTYAEGEYVHDCSSIWPQITYGEPDHWRNTMHAFYYCTHSIGPMFTISGLRPVEVTGFAMPGNRAEMLNMGCRGGTGEGAMEVIRMENGAIFKSLHGGLKREPGGVNYEVYGTRGCMETDRMSYDRMKVWRETTAPCHGEDEAYAPGYQIDGELAQRFNTHGGADFYPTHFFLQKILGRPDGERYSIDVYRGVEMGICGLLAYRSALNGSKPIAVPNLRDPAQRDLYRNDHACCDPAIAGDAVLPMSIFGDEMPAPEVYDHIRTLWQEGKEGVPYGGYNV